MGEKVSEKVSEEKTASRGKLIEKLKAYVGKKVVVNNVYEGILEDVYGEMIFLKLADGTALAMTRRSISTIKVKEQ